MWKTYVLCTSTCPREIRAWHFRANPHNVESLHSGSFAHLHIQSCHLCFLVLRGYSKLSPPSLPSSFLSISKYQESYTIKRASFWVRLCLRHMSLSCCGNHVQCIQNVLGWRALGISSNLLLTAIDHYCSCAFQMQAGSTTSDMWSKEVCR